MKVSLANPIYDVVFKFLMEDMRVAKIILSALLKREVVELEVRPEYNRKDDWTLYRVDYDTRVRQEDGSLKSVILELHKTWLEADVLAYRKYLSKHYADVDCSESDSSIIAIYLLAHRVGSIEEPVLYVSNNTAYNYAGEMITAGMPNAFIDSLQHESVIVQIPLFKGRNDSKLERIMSAFDISGYGFYLDENVTVEEKDFSDDPDLSYFLLRLLIISANTGVREAINTENLYTKELRDYKLLSAKEDVIIATANAGILTDIKLTQSEIKLLNSISKENSATAS